MRDVVAMTSRAAGLTRFVVGHVADKVILAGAHMMLSLRPSATMTSVAQ